MPGTPLQAAHPPLLVPSTAAVVGSVLQAVNLSAASLGPFSGQAANDIGVGFWFRTNTTTPGLDGSNSHFTGSPVSGPGGNRTAYTRKTLASGSETCGNTSNSVSRAVWLGLRNSPGAAVGILDFAIANGTGTAVTIPVPATPIPPEGVKVITLAFAATSNRDLSALIGSSGLIALDVDSAGAAYWRMAQSSGVVTSFAGGTFAIVSDSWSSITLYVR